MQKRLIWPLYSQIIIVVTARSCTLPGVQIQDLITPKLVSLILRNFGSMNLNHIMQSIDQSFWKHEHDLFKSSQSVINTYPFVMQLWGLVHKTFAKWINLLGMASVCYASSKVFVRCAQMQIRRQQILPFAPFDWGTVSKHLISVCCTTIGAANFMPANSPICHLKAQICHLMATHEFYATQFCLFLPLLGPANYPLTETPLKTWPKQTVIFARYSAKMFYAHQRPANRCFATLASLPQLYAPSPSTIACVHTKPSSFI